MKEIKFVDVGEGITEGHIVKWLVQNGDIVKEDQSIVQVETDKAVVDVPAPISGVVRIVAQADSTVHIGDVVGAIGAIDEMRVYKPGAPQAPAAKPVAPKQQPQQAQAAQPAAAPKQQPPQPQQAREEEEVPAEEQQQPAPEKTQTQKPAAQAPAKKEIIATPAIRKLARDMNVDLSSVTGTGPGGRVLEDDVKRAGAGQGAKPQAAPAMGQQQPNPALAMLEQKHKGFIDRVKMTQTRKAIARNMEESAKIPRAVHMDIINATSLFNLVAVLKPKILKEQNVKITFLPFIIKALIEGLKENPRFNASYDGNTGELLMKKYYNIGLAAEAPDGLKVVVIKDADKKSIIEIAKEIQDLHLKITNMSITLDEMKDSTFTITNIGSLGGGFESVPMINPGEAGILGIHMIKDSPIVVNGKIVVGKTLPYSIAFDHRIADGADAVKLGNAIMKYLEDPDYLEMLG